MYMPGQAFMQCIGIAIPGRGKCLVSDTSLCCGKYTIFMKNECTEICSQYQTIATKTTSINKKQPLASDIIQKHPKITNTDQKLSTTKQKHLNTNQKQQKKISTNGQPMSNQCQPKTPNINEKIPTLRGHKGRLVGVHHHRGHGVWVMGTSSPHLGFLGEGSGGVGGV